jgi:hypothetical protein
MKTEGKRVCEVCGSLVSETSEARALLAIQEKVYSPEHPDTLKARNNLAGTLSTEGKYAGAETEFREVIRLKEKVFGPELRGRGPGSNGACSACGRRGTQCFGTGAPGYQEV